MIKKFKVRGGEILVDEDYLFSLGNDEGIKDLLREMGYRDIAYEGEWSTLEGQTIRLLRPLSKKAMKEAVKILNKEIAI